MNQLRVTAAAVRRFPEVIITLKFPKSSLRSGSDGSTPVETPEGSRGDPPVASAQVSLSKPADNLDERSSGHPGSARGEEPRSPSRCKPEVISHTDRRGASQTRSTSQVSYSRSSSGYFSSEADSQPSSPGPVTATRGTQTPSLTAQVMKHALHCLGEAHDGGPATQDGSSPSPTGDMQAVEFGQELRRIGDEFNDHILRRGEHGHVGIYQNPLAHIHQEPTFLICIGLLLFVIGRYLQDSTNSHLDHSQV
ncbi:bcl-2-like protein 11 [Aulostomus maculatus]